MDSGGHQAVVTISGMIITTVNVQPGLPTTVLLIQLHDLCHFYLPWVFLFNIFISTHNLDLHKFVVYGNITLSGNSILLVINEKNCKNYIKNKTVLLRSSMMLSPAKGS